MRNGASVADTVGPVLPDRPRFKRQGPSADYDSMSISATSGYSGAALLEVQRQVAVMKKTADAQESQGQALVELVKQAAPRGSGAAPQRPGVGSHIDVYA
jgi:hypothetical protein